MKRNPIYRAGLFISHNSYSDLHTGPHTVSLLELLQAEPDRLKLVSSAWLSVPGVWAIEPGAGHAYSSKYEVEEP